MKRWSKIGLIGIAVILIAAVAGFAWFFSKAAPIGAGFTAKPKKTRAILVVYDGRLVAERYAPGFNKDMPLLGWSMSKSVTNALVGIKVKN